MIFQKITELIVLISAILCCSNVLALRCHNGTFFKSLSNNEITGLTSIIPCSNTATDVCVRTELKVENLYIVYDYTCEDFIDPLEDLIPYHDIESGCYEGAYSSQAVKTYERVMQKNAFLRGLYIKNVADYGIRMNICPCNSHDECNFIHPKEKSFFDFLF